MAYLIYYKVGHAWVSTFRIKDKINMFWERVLLTCIRVTCQQCYIGGTSPQLFIRSSKHVGVSYRTNTPLNKYSAIRDHSRTKNHPLRMPYFSVMCSVNNQSDLHISESLYISSLKPKWNDMQSSTPLNIVCWLCCNIFWLGFIKKYVRFL